MHSPASKKIRWGLFLICWLVASSTINAEPPRVRAVPQKLNHCGVASAETILRAYGIRKPWAKQTPLGASLCARMPEFKNRHRDQAAALEGYYPNFPETHQTLLAEMLIDRGLCVINTLSSAKLGRQKRDDDYWHLLEKHLLAGHYAIMHVPGHYFVATGVDKQRGEFYYVDPWRTEQTFTAAIDVVASGQPFRAKRSGKLSNGWTGRMLICWQGKKINGRDACPVCGKISQGKTFRWCPKCRCFIDRRENNRVQLAIDAAVRCAARYELVKVGRNELRARLHKLWKENKYPIADLKTALINYPLTGDATAKRLATLRRYAEANKLDLSPLSMTDLIDIVSSRNKWQTLLTERLAKKQRSQDKIKKRDKGASKSDGKSGRRRPERRD